MRVRILGGGVAGLAVALAFERRTGLRDLVVCERELTPEQAFRTGHGLMLMQNGVAALRALGADRLLAGATPLGRAIFQDAHGVVVRTEELEEVYCATRASIVEGLHRELQHAEVHYGQACSRVELAPLDEDRVRAAWVGEGDQARALGAEDVDLFVGAGGWRSPLCRALNPGLERPTSRVREIITSTEIPELASQLGGCFVKTMLTDRGAAFGVLAPTATRVIGFLQYDAERWDPPPRHATADDFARFLAAVTEGAPEPVPTYLRCCDLRSAHHWHPVNADLPPRIHCDNAVLVGDAFHPVLPFTSQAVSAALEDAILLADAVGKGGADATRLPAALAGFARSRRGEVASYIEGGRRILASFVDTSEAFSINWIDGAASRLEEHLSLPHGSLRGLFRVLDADGDGRLDRREVARAVALFGIELDDREKEAFFTHLDADGSGLVDLEEFVGALGGEQGGSELVKRVRAQLSPHHVELTHRRARCRALFDSMDADGNGLVDERELATSLALLGIVLSEERRRALFAELDADGDGGVTFEEMLDAVSRGAAEPLRERLAADAAPVAEEDALFAHARVDTSLLRRRAHAEGRWASQPADVIPFTAAEPDFPIAEAIAEAIRRHVADGYFGAGPAGGLPELLAAVARRRSARHGVAGEPDRVLAIGGEAAAVRLGVRLAIEQPGEEALVPDPSDPVLERSVLAAGGSVKRFALRGRGGRVTFDPAEVEALVVPGRTRLIAIANPHDPTGRVWEREELAALAAIAERHDLLLLADERWADIVHAPHAFTALASLDDAADRTVTALGFARSHGLGGLELGLLVAPTAATRARALALCAGGGLARASTLAQVAALAACRDADGWLERFGAHLTRQRDLAIGRLNAIEGVRCPAPEGTYVLLADLSAVKTPDGASADRIAERLRERDRVAVVATAPDLFGPGAAGHVRIAFATSREILAAGLDRLEAGLRREREGG